MNNLNSDIVFNCKNNINYLQFKSLLKYNNDIVHAIGYNNDYAIKENITNKQNYLNFCNELGIDYRKLFNIKQIHCDKYIFANLNTENNQEYDASITNIKNVPLLVKTADCMGILVYDYKNKYISAIHAGWKGVLNRITQKTINDMIYKYNCDPKSLVICVSPCICYNCFEVDKDVKDMFDNVFDMKYYLTEKGNNKYLIDLKSIVIDDMLSLGIIKDNITFSGYCTKCSEKGFYSYRKDNTEKRMSSIIMLK